MVEKHLSLIFILVRKMPSSRNTKAKMPIYYFERDCDVVYITQKNAEKTHLKSACDGVDRNCNCISLQSTYIWGI